MRPLWLMLVFSGLLVLYGISAREMQDPDVFVYAESVQLILDGFRLYDTTWQGKPTIGLLIYLIPQLLSRGSYLAIQVMFGLLMTLQTMTLIRLSRPEEREIALWTGLFLTILPLTDRDLIWLSSEQSANLFVVPLLGLALFIERASSFGSNQAFAIGVLGCLAFSVRQTAVVFALVPALSILKVGWSQGRVRDVLKAALLCVAGFAVTLLLVVGLTAGVGSVSGFFYTVFIWPRSYAAEGSLSDALTLFFSLGRKTLGVLTVALVVLCRRDPRFPLVVTAGLAAFFATIWPLQNFGHYLATFAPVAGLAFYVALTSAPAQRSWAGAVVCGTLMGALGYAGKLNQVVEIPTLERVAQTIDSLAMDERSTLFAIGRGSEVVYFASKPPPAHVHYWDLHIDSKWMHIMTSTQTISNELKASPPTLLAVPSRELLLVRGQAGPRDKPSIQIVRRLLDEVGYKSLAAVNGWTILGLRPKGEPD